MDLRGKARDAIEKSRLKITTKIILTSTFILIALIPALIINIIYYGKENDYIMQRLEQYNFQIVNKVGGQLNFILSQVDTINYELISMANEYNLFSINFKNYTVQNLEKIKLYEGVMQSIRRTLPAISDVYFIDPDGYLYSSMWSCDKEKLLQKEWIRNYKPVNGWTVIPTHLADYYDMSARKYEQVISFIKPVGEWTSTYKLDGIIQIDIKYDQIKQLVESAVTDGSGQIFLIDGSNSIVYGSDNSYLGKKFNQIIGTDFQEDVGKHDHVVYSGNNMIIIKNLPSMNWHIIEVIPTRERLYEIEKAKKIVIFITILAALFSLLIGSALSAAITKPLRKLMKGMNRIKVDEVRFEPIQFNTFNHDMKVLSDSYNVMLDKINILMKNIVKHERDKKNAELQMLQAQISPHFLYNTLNTIKWMAFMENCPRIADAIVSLVDLLEFCCKNRDSVIPVREELKLLNDYINIQQLRYNSKIKIVFEMDHGIDDMRILKFTLQPSVENAIIHAFTEMKEDATIFIRGRILEDRVVFEVEDNGVGIDDYTLKHMTGMGVSNVNDRIKLNFGDKFGQIIESEFGIGTKVTISLPKISEDEAGLKCTGF